MRPAGIGSEQKEEGALQSEVHESENDAMNAKDTLLQWQAAYSKEAKELGIQESGVDLNVHEMLVEISQTWCFQFFVTVYADNQHCTTCSKATAALAWDVIAYTPCPPSCSTVCGDGFCSQFAGFNSEGP